MQEERGSQVVMVSVSQQGDRVFEPYCVKMMILFWFVPRSGLKSGVDKLTVSTRRAEINIHVI
jgi:hypothetical protein